MYIKSIILDGFKSYMNRTEVSGFDGQFNAVTGLNGSGKSNILDSICFVLGISNLHNVRAKNIRNLIYKDGMGSVTEATVSITFDNTDKRTSPKSYEKYEEIVVQRRVQKDGKTNYMVNGVHAKQAKVTDLFKSVALNPDHPHFLILQGKVTKVLNMKPMEILGLLEENVGTKTYDEKREESVKMLAKKDIQLSEIERTEKEDILPSLERLRKDKVLAADFHNTKRTLEYKERLLNAITYMRLVAAKQDMEKLYEELQESSRANKQQVADLKLAIENKEAEVEKLKERRDREIGAKMNDLTGQADDKKKRWREIELEVSNSQRTRNNEVKKVADLKQSIADDEKNIEAKQREIEEEEAKFADLREEKVRAERDLKAAQEAFEAINAGKYVSLEVGADGGAVTTGTLQERLQQANREHSESDTELKKLEISSQQAKRDLTQKQQAFTKLEAASRNDQQTLDKYRRRLAEIEQQRHPLKAAYDEHSELLNQLQQSRRELSEAKRELRDCEQFHSLILNYDESFVRSGVYGLVARLIKVRDVQFSRAIEAAGGGKLFNVIVDNDETGQLMIDERAGTGRRLTVLPLNKIQSNPMQERVLRRAKQLVGDKNVWRAIDLIDFEPTFRPCIEYVFGNVLVTRDIDQATVVAYDDQVNKTCFALDGSSVQPSGMLAGGSRDDNFGQLFEQASLVNAAVAHHDKALNECNQVEARHRALSVDAERYASLSDEYDQRKHELAQAEHRIKASDQHQLQTDIQTLQASLEEISNKLAEAKEKRDKSAVAIRDLKTKLQNKEKHRELELKKARQVMQDAKKRLGAHAGEVSMAEQRVAIWRQEIVDLRANIDQERENQRAVEERLAEMDEAIGQLKEQVAAAKADHAATETELGRVKQQWEEFSRDMDRFSKEVQTMRRRVEDIDLQSNEDQQKVMKAAQGLDELCAKIGQMEQQHKFIVEDRAKFGQAGGEYDFAQINKEQLAGEVRKLQKKKEQMRRECNMQQVDSLNATEEQYALLKKRRTTVNDEKRKLLATIKELDKQKREELEKAYNQVNVTFGSIFSTLLPGGFAKLEKPDGAKSFMTDGLEFRVQIGNVWKENLSELSGGQRSLVSLSLILALLKYKPAPFYILDEIDAALDLSHTQNIGLMLSRHFQTSQFIIVSLKDGLFSNANVLFKTRFVNGVSHVSRVSRADNYQEAFDD